MVEKNDLLWNLAEQCIKQQNNYGYLVPDLFPSKHLFRYRANIERAIEEIRESYIYLSPIRNLNDPFDSSYVVSFEEAKTESHSAEFFYERCYFIKKAEWYGSVKNEMQITGILEKKKIDDLIATEGKSFSENWYGQLMTTPQMFAYLIQLEMWLRVYDPEICL